MRSSSIRSSIAMPPNLPRSVPAINDDVSPGSVRAGITGQIDIGALEFLGLGVTAERDHAVPHALDLLVHEIREARVDVAGGDCVDAGKVAPLVGERSGQVDAAGLGHVVRCLLLREVGDEAAHARRDDEGAGLSLAEVEADGAGAVEGAVQVGVDDLVPGLDGGVQDAGVGGPAGVGDEDVDAAEILDDVVDQLLDVAVVTDVALVGFGFDAVLVL